jgi:uncharacterized membrane protein
LIIHRERVRRSRAAGTCPASSNATYGAAVAITPGQLRRGAATSGEVVRLYNLYDLLAPLHRQTLAAADTAAALHLIDELDHQVLPVRS